MSSKKTASAQEKKREGPGAFGDRVHSTTPDAKREGPTTTRTTREGASVGKAANSTAAGAAGQLTPKD